MDPARDGQLFEVGEVLLRDVDAADEFAVVGGAAAVRLGGRGRLDADLPAAEQLQGLVVGLGDLPHLLLDLGLHLLEAAAGLLAGGLQQGGQRPARLLELAAGGLLLLAAQYDGLGARRAELAAGGILLLGEAGAGGLVGLAVLALGGLLLGGEADDGGLETLLELADHGGPIGAEGELGLGAGAVVLGGEAVQVAQQRPLAGDQVGLRSRGGQLSRHRPRSLGDLLSRVLQ